MHIVIIGNGIAGITAAITIRNLSNHRITVISAETEHFFARTALMYLFLGQLRYQDIKPYGDWFWAENKIELVQGFVNGIGLSQKSLTLATGEKLQYDKLLLATGSKVNLQHWPGQDLKGVQGFYSFQDLLQLEASCKHVKKAVIVGGGLIGVELAEMLHSRGISVEILVRENHYWGRNLPPEEAGLVEQTLRKNGISLRLKTELARLEGNVSGQVTAAVTTAGEEIACELVCLATGVKPNLELALKTELKTNRGIVVNEFLETSHPDVYAAGDCAELALGQSPVEQLWYTGRLQGETVAHTICGNKTAYNRGIPFNSAKFFDLEYQTYGSFNPELNEQEDSFFWQHPKDRISLRLIYLQDESKTITGFVLLGIRFRQAVCEKWLREKRSLDYVVQHLHEANFNEEFQRRYEKAIMNVYQNQHPESELPVRKNVFSRWL